MLGNLYLRRLVCHELLVSINSQNLQDQAEVAFDSLLSELNGCVYSVLTSHHHPLTPSQNSEPDLARGESQQWICTGHGNLIPLACDWSRDGHVTIQWDVSKHLPGEVSEKEIAFLINRNSYAPHGPWPLCPYCPLY